MNPKLKCVWHDNCKVRQEYWTRLACNVQNRAGYSGKKGQEVLVVPWGKRVQEARFFSIVDERPHADGATRCDVHVSALSGSFREREPPCLYERLNPRSAPPS